MTAPNDRTDSLDTTGANWPGLNPGRLPEIDTALPADAGHGVHPDPFAGFTPGVASKVVGKPPTLHDDDPTTECDNLARKIANFGADCLEGEHTDTSEAWELLHAARELLARVAGIEGELLNQEQIQALRGLGFDTEDAVRPDLGHAWRHVGEDRADAVAHGAAVLICDGAVQFRQSYEGGHLRDVLRDLDDGSGGGAFEPVGDYHRDPVAFVSEVVDELRTCADPLVPDLLVELRASMPAVCAWLA